MLKKNLYAAEFFVSIFHSSEVGIPNTTEEKKCLFMKNAHLQNVII